MKTNEGFFTVILARDVVCLSVCTALIAKFIGELASYNVLGKVSVGAKVRCTKPIGLQNGWKPLRFQWFSSENEFHLYMLIFGC